MQAMATHLATPATAADDAPTPPAAQQQPHGAAGPSTHSLAPDVTPSQAQHGPSHASHAASASAKQNASSGHPSTSSADAQPSTSTAARSSAKAGAKSTAKDAERLARLAEEREEAELAQKALRERHELPKTIEGFKKSKVCLLAPSTGCVVGSQREQVAGDVGCVLQASACAAALSACQWCTAGLAGLPSRVG